MSVAKMDVARALAEFQAGMKARDLERIMAVHSDDYRNAPGIDKLMLRVYFEGVIAQKGPGNMAIGLEDCEVLVAGGTAIAAPVTYDSLAGKTSFSYTFKKEADEEWRIVNSPQLATAGESRGDLFMHSDLVAITGDTSSTILFSRPEADTDPKDIVIHFHGFVGSPLAAFRDLHSHFVANGCAIVSFNYPGLWGTAGLFVPDTVFHQACDAVAHIASLHPHSNLHFFAESFGAAISLRVARSALDQVNLKTIAFRAPVSGGKNPNLEQTGELFDELSEMGILKTDFRQWQKMELGPPGGNIFDIDDNLESLQDRDFPKLVITGRHDELVAIADVVRTYKDYAEMDVNEDLPHNDMTNEQWADVVAKTATFFRR